MMMILRKETYFSYTFSSVFSTTPLYFYYKIQCNTFFSKIENTIFHPYWHTQQDRFNSADAFLPHTSLTGPRGKRHIDRITINQSHTRAASRVRKHFVLSLSLFKNIPFSTFPLKANEREKEGERGFPHNSPGAQQTGRK